MLLTLRDGNSTGSLYLCYLLHLLNVIIMYDQISTNVHLKQAFYVQVAQQYICACMYYWAIYMQHVVGWMCIYVDIAQLRIIYCYCLCAISLHLPFYNIAKCGFPLIMCHLSDDGLPLLDGFVINLLLYLFIMCHLSDDGLPLLDGSNKMVKSSLFLCLIVGFPFV